MNAEGFSAKQANSRNYTNSQRGKKTPRAESVAPTTGKKTEGFGRVAFTMGSAWLKERPGATFALLGCAGKRPRPGDTVNVGERAALCSY